MDFVKIPGFDVVPDGEYWTVVEDVELDVTKTSRRPRMTWTLRILGPDHYNCQLLRVLVITQESLQWLKKDLYVCGKAVPALKDLAGSLDDLLNMKLKVRKQSKAVHILDADAPVSAPGHLFLHLIDEEGREYLDQQLRPNRGPQDRHEFEAIIDHYVTRYQCPRPSKAFLEDSKSGAMLFSTDQP